MLPLPQIAKYRLNFFDYSMNSKQFVPIAKRLSILIDHGYKLFNLTDEYHNNIDYQSDLIGFVDGLVDKSHKIDLALLKTSISKDAFIKRVDKLEFPMLGFVEDGWSLSPIIFYKQRRGVVQGFIYRGNEETELEDASEWLEQLALDEDGKTISLTPFPLHSMLSGDENITTTITGPVSRMLKLLNAEKRDIFYIYFYSIVIALIGLSLPVGVQSIISLISGGVFFTSIVLLMALVVLGVLVAGILQLLQYTLVEVLERRIFVKAAFELSFRIPRVNAEHILGEYPPELMNRFFDVLTIQKGMPKLLIDVTSSVLQIVFGLALISFYHPLFIFFGLGLLSVLVIIFYFTGPNGLKTSLIESKYKYKVAHWLEELARVLYSFKLAGHTNLPFEKMDSYVDNYLHYRKKHFGVLMNQYISVVAFRVLVTGGMLVLGSFLVIDRSITLGQFVASEIVVVTILNASEKFVFSMSTIYDMLTAVEKIGYVTDIELERKGGITIPYDNSAGMEVETKDLSYKYPGQSEISLKNVNLHINSGESIGIAGFSSSGKNTLLRVLSGLLDSYTGSIILNKVSMRDINLASLRDNLAKSVSHEDIFDGNILENISMGKARVSYKDVMWALENVGLDKMVESLPKGLMTEMVASGRAFSASTATKMIIARCIAERPQLLILNDIMHDLEKSDRMSIIQFLISKENPWTLLMVSNDPLVLAACDRVIFMEKGSITASGTYSELLGNDSFRDCVKENPGIG